MKKVLQLTFHCPTNYGAVLQTYALGKVLKNLGYEVGLLNLRPSWMSPVWQITKPLMWIARWKFDHFAKGYFTKMTPCFRDSSQLKEQCKDIDAVVVGSDQVWNPDITRHFSDDYFLKFVPDSVRRIAYAASFGIGQDEWLKKNDAGHYGALLQDFYSISVREISGVELCLKLNSDIKPQVVLDPTLLLSDKDYKKEFNLKERCYGIVSFKFIKSTSYYQMLKQMEFRLKKKVVLLNSRAKKSFYGIQTPSPIVWLETIAGASFVVTDSFHATCFAIIFRKEFLVLPSYLNRIGRLKSLLEQLGISDRLCLSEDDLLRKLPTIKKIDYEKVNMRLQKLRESSIGFLSSSLS